MVGYTPSDGLLMLLLHDAQDESIEAIGTKDMENVKPLKISKF